MHLTTDNSWGANRTTSKQTQTNRQTGSTNEGKDRKGITQWSRTSNQTQTNHTLAVPGCGSMYWIRNVQPIVHCTRPEHLTHHPQCSSSVWTHQYNNTGDNVCWFPHSTHQVHWAQVVDETEVVLVVNIPVLHELEILLFNLCIQNAIECYTTAKSMSVATPLSVF